MILTVICDVLGKENNGTTIAAMNLIRSMRAKGHTVRVVCSDEFRRGDKDVYVIPKLNLGPLNGYLAKNRVQLAKPDKRVIREALEGADAVHFITPFRLSRCALKVRSSRRCGRSSVRRRWGCPSPRASTARRRISPLTYSS